MKSIIKSNSRFFLVFTGVLLFMAAITCLNLLSDDEKYYMMYDFEGVKESVYDYGRGILSADAGELNPGESICTTPAIHIEPGRYHIQISHQQDTDSTVLLEDNGRILEQYDLPASEADTDLIMECKDDIYHFTVCFLYQGGKVDIKHLYFRSEGLLYTDTAAFFVAALLFAIVFMLIFLKRISPAGLTGEKLYYFFFPAFFIFINYVYFREYWPYDQGDFSFWVPRIEQLKRELLRGQIPVQLLGDGLGGHGVLNSLYPSLFACFPALLRICHVSMEASIRITCMLVNLAAMFTSYHAAKQLSDNRKTAILGMVLYTTLPYRLGIMYFRFAFGEVLAMIFIPLVIEGIYNVFEGDYRRWHILAIGMTGIMQSHILSVVMCLFFSLGLTVLLAGSLFNELIRAVSVLKAVLLFTLLNLWYIVPFIECYGYDLKLTEMFAVADFSRISHEPGMLFSVFQSFLPVTEHYKTPMLGPALWVCLCVAVYFCLFSSCSGKKTRFCSALVISGLFFLCMTTRWFPWHTLEKISIVNSLVQMIQFPIRFGQIAQGSLVFAGVIAISGIKVSEKAQRLLLAGCVISACAMMIIISDSWSECLTIKDPGEVKMTADIDAFYNEDYAMSEYNSEFYPDGPDSNALITGYEKNGCKVDFDYVSETDAYVYLPLQSYPGYRAVSSSDGILNITSSEYAMMQVSLPAAVKPAHVTIEYVQPVRWRISLIASIITVVFTVLWRFSARYNVLHGPGAKRNNR